MPRGPMTEEAKQARREKMEANKGLSDMNVYARRIYDNQSPDLPNKHRVDRILAGLKGQGYTDFSDLELPIKDFKRYL